MAKNKGKGTREQRIERATDLIKRHPSWGKDHVNKTLKREFGVGLQRIYVAHLKTEVLKPTLTVEQKREHKLINKGFLPSEAKALSGFQITSPVMAQYIKERRDLIRSAKKTSTPRSKLTQEIKLDYRINGYTKKGKTDYSKAFTDWANKFITKEKLKKETAYNAPKKVTYTEEQHRIYKDLRAHGFTKYEAQILAKGDTTVQAYGTGPWKDAMTNRIKYINDLRARGWTWPQIQQEFKNYYRQGIKRSPWDFIRANYQPKRKVAKSEFKQALARRQQQRSSRLAHRRIKSHFQGALQMGEL